MKKQAFIHLHGLLVEVDNYMDTETSTPEYDGLGTKPTSIHESKTDHKEAVLTLCSELADEAENTVEAQ